MIDFMVIAAPRSATTWASNWLTTDTTLCIHDPLYTWHYNQLDGLVSKKSLGVSCTGLYWFSEWVNKHPARKVILHRDVSEIDESLIELGLPALDADVEKRLDSIKGVHLDWRDVFDAPKRMYEYLLERPFDAERHAVLREIEMQPQFAGLTINKEAVSKLYNELRSI